MAVKREFKDDLNMFPNLTLEELKEAVENLGGVLILDSQGKHLLILSWERYGVLSRRSTANNNEVDLKRYFSAQPHVFLEEGGRNEKDGQWNSDSMAMAGVAPGEEKKEQEMIDRLNRDIEFLKEEIKKRELAELETEKRP